MLASLITLSLWETVMLEAISKDGYLFFSAFTSIILLSVEWTSVLYPSLINSLPDFKSWDISLRDFLSIFSFDKTRLSNIKKFNITEEEYIDHMNSQKGCCAICKESIDVVHIDHNHKTGKVRGLLCRGCNSGIGHLKDNPDTCMRATTYLLSRGYYG